MRSRFALILTAVALLVVTACDREQTSSTPSTSGGSDLGDGVTRIVSLAPSATETLFALEVGERVVGVTRFCDYPKEVAELPKVGGLTDVDVEMVLSLRPDLVVGVESETGSSLQKTLQGSDVDTLFVPVESFADVQEAVAKMAEAVGAEAKGKEIVDRIGAIDEKPASDAPEVLVLFGKDPWVAAGPGTFADEMIRRAGGRNVLREIDSAYPTLDLERLSALQPAVVIDTSWGGGKQPEIPLKGVDVVRLDPALIRPGPRLAQAMKQFKAAVDANR